MTCIWTPPADMKKLLYHIILTTNICLEEIYVKLLKLTGKNKTALVLTGMLRQCAIWQKCISTIGSGRLFKLDLYYHTCIYAIFWNYIVCVEKAMFFAMIHRTYLHWVFSQSRLKSRDTVAWYCTHNQIRKVLACTICFVRRENLDFHSKYYFSATSRTTFW